MAKKPIPTLLWVIALLFVFGVYFGNRWVSIEIEQAVEAPVVVPPSSQTVAHKKAKVIDADSFMQRENRVLADMDKGRNDLKKAAKAKRVPSERIIYEKPLDSGPMLN